ncbi:HEAT repeat domain-containing protein [Methylobacterium nigriterrae]|uniref:HEAT repeat domain-containing protein n=1 Tax=Methylobacterium nigriterrae TaxID=3127512 RepID=UPI0030137150
MPLVRPHPPHPTRSAATPVVGRSETADELGAALGTESDPRAREALLAALLAIADDAAAAALARHLRSENAGLRNACIEALQAMPFAAFSVLPALLADADPDVRLLATEIARAQPTETANALLAALLAGEAHPNVCGAAVEVLAEVGTAEAVPALRAARARFAKEAFLPMAIDTVLARLASGH